MTYWKLGRWGGLLGRGGWRASGLQASRRLPVCPGIDAKDAEDTYLTGDGCLTQQNTCYPCVGHLSPMFCQRATINTAAIEKISRKRGRSSSNSRTRTMRDVAFQGFRKEFWKRKSFQSTRESNLSISGGSRNRGGGSQRHLGPRKQSRLDLGARPSSF